VLLFVDVALLAPEATREFHGAIGGNAQAAGRDNGRVYRGAAVNPIRQLTLGCCPRANDASGCSRRTP
jgi:hypothetical protein